MKNREWSCVHCGARHASGEDIYTDDIGDVHCAACKSPMEQNCMIHISELKAGDSFWYEGYMRLVTRDAYLGTNPYGEKLWTVEHYDMTFTEDEFTDGFVG